MRRSGARSWTCFPGREVPAAPKDENWIVDDGVLTDQLDADESECKQEAV
jgi:hypothetical protein